MKTMTKLWIGIGILILLSPLGLLLPEHYKAGTAWGEWGTEEVQHMVGYVPQGLAKSTTYWNAPMPDYAFKGWAEKGISHLSVAYIVSAAAGIILAVLAIWLIGKLLVKKNG